MEVLAFDPYTNNFLAEVLDFQYTPLDKLLKESDIISLHVPHNKHTHHLISRERIAKMKKGAIIINTARGEIIDTNALLDALDSGQIAGAGLDVLEGENLIKEEKQLLYEENNIDSLKRPRPRPHPPQQGKCRLHTSYRFLQPRGPSTNC